METEKLQRPIKIIKKHLKTNNFNSDVYILNYQVSFFNIKIWREFPIYFCREDILKDFIETAYIFNFKFYSLCWCTPNYQCYNHYIESKNFTIYFRNISKIMGKYYIFTECSDFVIKENKNEDYAPIYANKNLSVAYGLYNNDIKYGLSEPLEEKTYKLALEEK